MTCVPTLAQFRLLNHLVGWDVDEVDGLTGMDTATGVQLQPFDSADNSLDEATLSMWLAPPRLAQTCDGCGWYLVTPCPPQSRLLMLNACEPCWTQPQPGAVDVLTCASAVAVSPQRIAVTDTAAESILFFTAAGRRQLGQVPFAQPGVIAYATWQEWLVVDEQAGVLRRLDLAGVDLGVFHAQLPAHAPGTIERLAVDEQCRVWIAIKQTDKRYALWWAGKNDRVFTLATPSELQQAFKPNGLVQVTDEGFCFQEKAQSCGPCFSWYGRSLESLLASTPAPLFATQGQLLTLAIDTGLPRCRWHRVRIEADIPSGTAVAVAVSSSETPIPTSQGIATGAWAAFAAGVPHPSDWQEAVLNSDDFLIQQPPGRYLFVRLRLSGDGFCTPRVERIRLDFPRQTSLDQLPVVYRGYGVADGGGTEDFSERFLSLFDAFLENADNAIEHLPALLDTTKVADTVLPWLGSFLDIAMDPAWDVVRRRRILQAAPKLYRLRGTLDGMRMAIHLVFDVEPVIQELPIERPWGAVGGVRLANGVRLFGRSRWRFSLGRSRLSQAPLRSFGNPDRDPFNALAYQFNVLVPLVLNVQTRQRLQQLIDAQKPAHTVVTLRDSSGAFILGAGVCVGIDTTFKPFAASVLEAGDKGVRLGRSSVLASARMKSGQGLVLGRGGAVGVNSELG